MGSNLFHREASYVHVNHNRQEGFQFCLGGIYGQIQFVETSMCAGVFRILNISRDTYTNKQKKKRNNRRTKENSQTIQNVTLLVSLESDRHHEKK